MEATSSPSSSSSSALSHKSKERVFHLSPRKTHNSKFTPLFVFVLCISFIPIPTSAFEATYDQHCNPIVPRSPSLPDRFAPSSGSAGLPSPFRLGFFRGGAPLLSQNPANDVIHRAQFMRFGPYGAVKTNADGVYAFWARLSLQDFSGHRVFGNYARRGLRSVRFWGLKSPVPRYSSFSLMGFWSEASRKLCMVGSGSAGPGHTGIAHSILSVVLKLNYPLNSTIYNSLVSGTLESLDKNHSFSYFEPISLMGFSQDSSYEYTLLGKENGDGCSSGGEIGESLSILTNKGLCSILDTDMERFELEYGSECNGGVGVDCNPLGGILGYVPKYMYYYRTRCTNGTKWQMFLSFPNSTFDDDRYPFRPSTTFIAEGAWNEKENRFCAVACRIFNLTDSSGNAYVGDCSVGFSLWFPASLSLRNRSTIVGQVWNISAANQSGKIGFRRYNVGLLRMAGFKYKYTTKIETLNRICGENNTTRSKGKTYPIEYSQNMVFDMSSVRNSKGQVAWGYSMPLYVGAQYFGRYMSFMLPTNSQQVMQNESSVLAKVNQSSLVNVSYRMMLNFAPDFEFSRDCSSLDMEISAEGTYDRDTGVLCMVGCRKLGSKIPNLVTNDTLDCAITVTVQFPPLNANSGRTIKGIITSTRQKSDPFYFGRLELSSNSIYSQQAAASIRRMNLEMTMVLISNTLTGVFVGLQLFYIKSHPNALAFISIVMLIVLSMGSLIPLLLNFESLFVPNLRQLNIFLGSGVRLKVNEVIVRIVTLITFLLQLRLLQLTWSSRQGDGSEKSLWNSECKVLYVTLPIYVGGALIVWFVNHLNNSSGISNRPSLNPHQTFYVKRYSQWEGLKSYAGLVLDGFLLPQILLNMFSNSGEKALAPLFYAGTTLVRVLPHAYDLYRAHAYGPNLELSYIYASHRMNLYSTAWNTVITIGGLLFAVLIFLQQRFGGVCVLPRRFRQSSVYEKVPGISNEDL